VRPKNVPLRTALHAVALAAAAWGCSDITANPPNGFAADIRAPVVTLDTATAKSDTSLAFVVHARDDLDVARLRIEMTGGMQRTLDTTFATSGKKSYDITYNVPVPRSVPFGAAVEVYAIAEDGAHNADTSATLRLVVGNVKPPTVTITSPRTGTIVAAGSRVAVRVSASARTRVRILGYAISGSNFTMTDSSVLAAPRDTATVTFSPMLPDTTKPGNLKVVPWVVDSIGQRVYGDTVVLNVVAPSNIASTATVSPTEPPRIEVGDPIAAADVAGTGTGTGTDAVAFELRARRGTAARRAYPVEQRLGAVERPLRLGPPIDTYSRVVFVRVPGEFRDEC